QPRVALERFDLAQQCEPDLIDFRDQRQMVAGEYRLDRIEVVVAHAARKEVGVGRPIVAEIAEHELRDGLVGARIIENYDLAEVENGEAAIAQLDDLALDAEAQRAARGSRNEMRVQAGDRAAHEGVQVDRDRYERLLRTVGHR